MGIRLALRGQKEGSAHGGLAVLKTVPSACTRRGFDSFTFCMDDGTEDWMWITIRVPLSSRFNERFPKTFEAMGFKFDAYRIGLVHEDGTTIEYAPGPPPRT